MGQLGTASALTVSDNIEHRLQQTDIGLIPIDWGAVRLDTICRLVNGRGFKPHEWRTRGLPIIRIQNLNGSPDFNYFEGAYDRKLEVQPGQLLFAWSGSRGTSFGPHVWPGPLGLLNYHTWKIEILNEEVSPAFLFHALKHLTAFIESWAHGASALVHVQKWQMEAFKIAVPQERSEQEAIAQALSDADALIEELERLIAKKRAIKQGAMQDLLSGRRRLPGFTGEWRTRKFGSITAIRNQKVATFGNPPAAFCVELEHIASDAGQLLGSSDATARFASKYRFQLGDVLFGRLRPYLRKFWQADRDGVCSTEVWPLIPASEDLAPSFLYQLVQSDGFVEAASSSYGTHMPRTDWKALCEYEAPVPTERGEQQAVAEALLEMEAEVVALDARLGKARQIKHGMMQELLTGRVRLV